MFDRLHNKKKLQLFIGFLIGIVFGFLLQKGGATQYDVIINQLLLRDFTVLKIMFAAIIVGMIGIYAMKALGLIELQPKPCNVYPIIIGGLIFGAGFALLGYCPGTSVGAVGSGSIHALIGVVGILTGAGIYASIYPLVRKNLDKPDLGNVTLPELFGVNQWILIFLITVILVVIMYLV